MPAFEELKILGFDHLEIAVKDLDKASSVFQKAGFARLGQRVIRERQLRSYVVGQNAVRIVLNASEEPKDPVAQYLAKHGEGIMAAAFLTEDAAASLDVTARRGAMILEPPHTIERDLGSVTQARIGTPGDFTHLFLSREGTLFAEAFDSPLGENAHLPGPETIEGLALAIEPDQTEAWSQYYSTIFGLQRQTDQNGQWHYAPRPGLSGIISFEEATSGAARNFVDIHHGSGIRTAKLGTQSRDKEASLVTPPDWSFAFGLAAVSRTGFSERKAG